MEALIKVTKRCLKALAKDRLLREVPLHTLLLEIESIVNNGPLTSISDNFDDLEPLIPNHFLIS